MWLWLGIGSIAAYVLMRSKEKRWTRSGKPQSGHFRGVEVRYDLDQITRFAVTHDTLAVRLTLPLAGRVEDFHLKAGAPCRAHPKKMPPEGGIHSGGERGIRTLDGFFRPILP